MTVLILGAGVMQLPAIRIARELGWHVAAADGNPSAPGAGLCDTFYAIDLKDKEGLVEAAKSLRGGVGLDGVFTAGTDFSASVAWVAEKLGLPGISYETALAASDKVRMRRIFQAAGIPSPRFVELRGPEEASTASVRALGFPLVVKPADSMGARGCRSVASLPDLMVALAEALPHSRSGRAIVEEFVDGPEFSVDAIVCDGKIEIRGLADRHIVFAPYFVEVGHTIPSSAPEPIQTEVLRVFRDSVRALGINEGVAKGDIKFSPNRGEAVVGEIAARLSGGYMSGWTFPYASGIEVTREALELACGRPISPAGADRGWTSAERALVSVPGRVSGIIGLRAAQESPFVKDVFLRCGRGDTVRFPSNNVEKCGNMISQAPDRASAVAAAEDAVSKVLILLTAPNPETDAFLAGAEKAVRGAGAAWPPPAYCLPPAAELELREMKNAPRGEIPSQPRIMDLKCADLIEALDWNYRSYQESASLATKIGDATIGPDGDPGLGYDFWSALAQGGAQAGIYILDRFRARGGT